MAAAPPPLKYHNVRIVAKVRCAGCHGTGRMREIDMRGLSPADQEQALDAARRAGNPSCKLCDGTGEVEQELLHPGEPFFLLRGQDAYARTGVLLYAALRVGDDPEHDERVGGWDGLAHKAAEIAEWQARNPGLVKKPD